MCERQSKARQLSEPVDYILDGRGVAHITLNRPHRLNAITASLVSGLVAALRTAESDGARVVTLRGAGTSFCAGHDLREPQEPYTFERGDHLQDVTRCMRALPAPVLSVVQGYAIGGGFEFALASDLIVAADSSQFQFPEVDVGLSATGGATALLPRIVGPIRAKRLMLLGERVSAGEALALGLITMAVPDDELDQTIEGIIDRLLKKSGSSLTLAKRAIDIGSDGTLEASLAVEVDHLVRLSSSEEAAVAAERFRASASAKGSGGSA